MCRCINGLVKPPIARDSIFGRVTIRYTNKLLLRLVSNDHFSNNVNDSFYPNNQLVYRLRNTVFRHDHHRATSISTASIPRDRLTFGSTTSDFFEFPNSPASFFLLLLAHLYILCFTPKFRNTLHATPCK